MDELWKKFARAVEDVVARSSDLNFGEACIALDNVQTEFLHLAAGDTPVETELKRRISEQKFLLAGEKDEVSVEEIEARYETIRKDSYLTSDRSCTFQLIFSRFCLWRNDYHRASRAIEELRNHLELAIRPKHPCLYADLIENVNEISRELHPHLKFDSR